MHGSKLLSVSSSFSCYISNYQQDDTDINDSQPNPPAPFVSSESNEQNNPSDRSTEQPTSDEEEISDDNYESALKGEKNLVSTTDGKVLPVILIVIGIIVGVVLVAAVISTVLKSTGGLRPGNPGQFQSQSPEQAPLNDVQAERVGQMDW